MPTGEKNFLAKMTGAQQTMQSWVKVIDTWDEVPEIYQAVYRSLVDPAALPYTVFTPPQGGVRGRRPAERLLCDLGDTFAVLEWTGRQVVIYQFPWKDIYSLELGNVLLYSWFSIHGCAVGGSPSALTVDFNESTIRHLEPFFRKMRPPACAPQGYDFNVELHKLDYLERVHFKFMSFARRSLTPGQRIVQSLYQPALRQPLLTVLGRSLYRTLVRSHMILLTDQEVVLIAEVGQSSKDEGRIGKYQGIWRFVPLQHLRAAALAELSGGLCAFTFHLADGAQVTALFDGALSPQIESLKTALDAVLEKPPIS